MTTSPTSTIKQPDNELSSNTEDELKYYDEALDFLIDAIDRGEIEVGKKRADGQFEKSIANTATKRLSKLLCQHDSTLKAKYEEKLRQARLNGALRGYACDTDEEFSKLLNELNTPKNGEPSDE